MTDSRPNILMIVVDQYRFPRFSNGPQAEFHEDLKKVLGFHGDVTDLNNTYAQFFPGLLRLRHNAVVLTRHMIASSACTPSRAALFTGQYGTRTGVTKTDGLFQVSGASPIARDPGDLPRWISQGEAQAMADSLAALLAEQEAAKLSEVATPA